MFSKSLPVSLTYRVKCNWYVHWGKLVLIIPTSFSLLGFLETYAGKYTTEPVYEISCYSYFCFLKMSFVALGFVSTYYHTDPFDCNSRNLCSTRRLKLLVGDAKSYNKQPFIMWDFILSTSPSSVVAFEIFHT